MKNKKLLILVSILIITLLLCTTIYLVYFHKTPTTNPEPQLEKYLLDTRFLVLYGKITKTNANSIDIEVIKDPTLTDYVFDDINNINLVINKDSIIKGFNVEKKVYSDLKVSNIKPDSFVTAYINNATSSGFTAIGIKVFDINIIK